MYQNGAKVFSFHFNEEKHSLPSTLFEKVVMLNNFRGMFTDLQIFESFSNEEKLQQLSTHCDQRKGEIFSWDRNKLKTVSISLKLIVGGAASLYLCLPIYVPTHLSSFVNEYFGMFYNMILDHSYYLTSL